MPARGLAFATREVLAAASHYATLPVVPLGAGSLLPASLAQGPGVCQAERLDQFHWTTDGGFQMPALGGVRHEGGCSAVFWRGPYSGDADEQHELDEERATSIRPKAELAGRGRDPTVTPSGQEI